MLPIGFPTRLGPLLNEDHIYTLIITVDDKARTTQQLETNRRRFKSLSVTDRDNAVAEADTESFLQDAAAGDRVLVKAHINIMVWAETRTALAEARSRTVKALTDMGITPRLESIGALPVFLAGAPGNAPQLPSYQSFQTFADQAACFFIPETYGKGSVGPTGLRLGERVSGVPLQVDISDTPLRKSIIANFNKLIVGPTGSGKTLFCLHLVRCYFERQAHITIVDIGNSYKGLCEHLGGRYFAWTPEQPLAFNPFQLTENEKPDFGKRETLKTLLLILWKQPGEVSTRFEYILLSDMIDGYYQFLDNHSEISPCFDSFYEWLKESFNPPLTGKEPAFDLDSFLYILRPFYRGGEYDYLLNAREQLDLLHEQLIVFELDAVKSHPILFPVLSLLIIDTHLAKLQKLPGVRKVLLMDEAWKAIRLISWFRINRSECIQWAICHIPIAQWYLSLYHQRPLIGSIGLE